MTPRSQRHLFVHGGMVLTQDAGESALLGDILITDGRIAAVGRDLPVPVPARWLDAEGMVVIPGLVHTHTHLGRLPYRGLIQGSCKDADAVELDGRHDDDTAYASTLLGAVECLLSGTTLIGEFGLPRGEEGMQRALVESGIRWRLRAGNAPCDGVQDRFEALRRMLGVDPTARGADLLRRATRDGAEAMGLGAEVGSLEPGKAGDLVVLDLRGHRGFAHPEAPLPERIVRQAGRWSIRWVVVDGEVLVEDGRMPHLNLDALTGSADRAARALFDRPAAKEGRS